MRPSSTAGCGWHGSRRAPPRGGGRSGRAQAMVGGVLGVRPILTLRDGEVEPLRRVRGARRARAEFERFLIEHAGPGSVHVAVVHAEAPEAAEQLVEMARRA